MENFQLRVPDVNSVTIVGNVVETAEFKRTKTDKGFTSFRIAYSKRYKDKVTGEWKNGDPVFINVVYWTEFEDLVKKLTKGAPVNINGRLSQSNWEDKDTGKKQSRIEIVAERVQALRKDDAQTDLPIEDNKPKEQSSKEQSAPEPKPKPVAKPAAPKKEFEGPINVLTGDDEDDDNIPF